MRVLAYVLACDPATLPLLCEVASSDSFGAGVAVCAHASPFASDPATLSLLRWGCRDGRIADEAVVVCSISPDPAALSLLRKLTHRTMSARAPP